MTHILMALLRFAVYAAVYGVGFLIGTMLPDPFEEADKQTWRAAK